MELHDILESSRHVTTYYFIEDPNFLIQGWVVHWNKFQFGQFLMRFDNLGLNQLRDGVPRNEGMEADLVTDAHDLVLKHRLLHQLVPDPECSLFTHGVQQRGPSAPLAINRLQVVDQKLEEPVHIGLVPDDQIHRPILQLEGKAFPGQKWQFVCVLVVFLIHGYHVFPIQPKSGALWSKK